jgi:hypothetical protein
MLLKKCKACLETIETDKFTFRINSYGKRYPLSVCKACKARAARINRNDLESEMAVVKEYDPREFIFEDDPRALKEEQYGKVNKLATVLPTDGISYD